MIGSWLYGYRGVEEELARIEAERNIVLAKTTNISVEDMIKSEMNAINQKYHGIRGYTAPVGNGTYPLDVINKYRNSYRVAAPRVLYYNNDPKKYGDGRAIPLWKGAIPDINGRKPETMRYLIDQITYPIRKREKLCNDFPKYPEYYFTAQVIFNSLIVPIIKYIKSLGWNYSISSGPRSIEEEVIGGVLVNRINLTERYHTNITGSDHNKAAAFDIVVTPKGGISAKAANAFLFKQIMLRQVPNLPGDKYIRQVLLEFNENSVVYSRDGSGSANKTGWVHVAGRRFAEDKTAASVYQVMCQTSSRGDVGLGKPNYIANERFKNGTDMEQIRNYFNGSRKFKYYLAGTNKDGYLTYANQRYSEFIQINRMHS